MQSVHVTGSLTVNLHAYNPSAVDDAPSDVVKALEAMFDTRGEMAGIWFAGFESRYRTGVVMIETASDIHPDYRTHLEQLAPFATGVVTVIADDTDIARHVLAHGEITTVHGSMVFDHTDDDLLSNTQQPERTVEADFVAATESLINGMPEPISSTSAEFLEEWERWDP